MHRVAESAEECREVTVVGLCRRVGMSKQNYYKRRSKRQRAEVDKDLILALVGRERQVQPRVGGRKLLCLLSEELEIHDVSIGRDRFFELLRDNDLLVPRKRGQPRTTNSRHSLPVVGNLIADLELSSPHEVWVSDLTYIRTSEGFMFGAIIMDLYSRKLVGCHIGDSLETIGCLEALDEALRGLPSGKHPIHHSDRGCQYCSHAYMDRLKDRGLSVSMTEVLHCYENAAAERVIGTLKQEYELDREFRTKTQACGAFEQAVYLYNNRRPHQSLAYATPAEIHRKAAA